jgi:hypothetical protein
LIKSGLIPGLSKKPVVVTAERNPLAGLSGTGRISRIPEVPMRIARFLFGYRDDLDLAGRWWHRLITVVFACGMLIVAAMAVLAFLNRPYFPRKADITPIIALRQMTKQAPADVSNTIPDFLKIDGDLGALKDGRLHPVNEAALLNGICSSNLRQHLDELAQALNRVPPVSTDITAAIAGEFLTKSDSDLKPGDERRYCWYDADAVPFMSSDILKYRRTWKAYARQYSIIALKTGGTLATLAWLLSTFYYRGVVYIVCGGRKQTPANDVVSV